MLAAVAPAPSGPLFATDAQSVEGEWGQLNKKRKPEGDLESMQQPTFGHQQLHNNVIDLNSLPSYTTVTSSPMSVSPVTSPGTVMSTGLPVAPMLTKRIGRPPKKNRPASDRKPPTVIAGVGAMPQSTATLGQQQQQPPQMTSLNTPPLPPMAQQSFDQPSSPDYSSPSSSSPCSSPTMSHKNRNNSSHKNKKLILKAPRMKYACEAHRRQKKRCPADCINRINHAKMMGKDISGKSKHHHHHHHHSKKSGSKKIKIKSPSSVGIVRDPSTTTGHLASGVVGTARSAPSDPRRVMWASAPLGGGVGMYTGTSFAPSPLASFGNFGPLSSEEASDSESGSSPIMPSGSTWDMRDEASHLSAPAALDYRLHPTKSEESVDAFLSETGSGQWDYGLAWEDLSWSSQCEGFLEKDASDVWESLEAWDDLKSGTHWETSKPSCTCSAAGKCDKCAAKSFVMGFISDDGTEHDTAAGATSQIQQQLQQQTLPPRPSAPLINATAGGLTSQLLRSVANGFQPSQRDPQREMHYANTVISRAISKPPQPEPQPSGATSSAEGDPIWNVSEADLGTQIKRDLPVGPTSLRWLISNIVLTRETLERWISEPHFNKLLQGYYVRVRIGEIAAQAAPGIEPATVVPVFRIAQIAQVQDGCFIPYRLQHDETTKGLVLQVGGSSRRVFGLLSVSNQLPTSREFERWEEEMLRSKTALPLEEVKERLELLYAMHLRHNPAAAATLASAAANVQKVLATPSLSPSSLVIPMQQQQPQPSSTSSTPTTSPRMPALRSPPAMTVQPILINGEPLAQQTLSS